MENTVSIQIDGHTIGPGEPTFVIAELGINHNGDVGLARELVDAAADAGADAVKFQSNDPDASYVPGTPSHEVFSGARLSKEQYQALIDHCDERKIVMFTTPGDLPTVELVRELSLPAIKVSSGLMTNLPVVLAAARVGVPLIISTGGAHLWEVGRVVHELESIGKSDFALLHCVSIYPADDETLNLRAIVAMQEAFPYPIGYSDHSMGGTASVAAATLGACVIEKHFTLDRELPGGDNFLSSEADEFAAMMREIRACEKMLGRVEKRPGEGEVTFRDRMRRRLVANGDVARGQTLTADLVGLKRPLQPGGLSPDFYEVVIGKKATRDLRQHEPIDWDAITETEQ